MKKILTLFIVAMLLVVTGCGKGKTLECSTEISGSKQTMAVEYDGDNVKTMKLTLVIASDAMAELGMDVEDTTALESFFCSTYNTYEGMDCEVSSKNDNFEMKVTVDYDKVDEATKTALGYEEQSYDALKEELEGQGYTCK